MPKLSSPKVWCFKLVRFDWVVTCSMQRLMRECDCSSNNIPTRSTLEGRRILEIWFSNFPISWKYWKYVFSLYVGIFTKKTRAEISRRMHRRMSRDLSYETDSGQKLKLFQTPILNFCPSPRKCTSLNCWLPTVPLQCRRTKALHAGSRPEVGSQSKVPILPL